MKTQEQVKQMLEQITIKENELKEIILRGIPIEYAKQTLEQRQVLDEYGATMIEKNIFLKILE